MQHEDKQRSNANGREPDEGVRNRPCNTFPAPSGLPFQMQVNATIFFQFGSQVQRVLITRNNHVWMPRFVSLGRETDSRSPLAPFQRIRPGQQDRIVQRSQGIGSVWGEHHLLNASHVTESHAQQLHCRGPFGNS